MMEDFCDTPFWNTSQVWEGSWPQFTSCFQDTVLIWVPCGFLWLASFFYIYSMVAHYPSVSHHATKLFLAKLILTGLLFVAAVVQMLKHITDHIDDKQSVVKADVFGSGCLAITVLLALFLTVMERRKGFITSGVQFMFWLLLAITQIVPFYTLIELKEYDSSILKFSLFYIQYAFILLLLLVHCFAEKTQRPFQPIKKPCPETESSFLSRLTFWWANGLFLQGYRTPLTEQMMPDLNPREKSCNVVPRFLRNWYREVNTARAKFKIEMRKRQRRSSFYRGESSQPHVDETTPLIAFSDNKNGESKKKKPLRPQPSLMKILFKTFGLELVRGQIWKLFYDALILSNPLVLGQLVQFIEDINSPVWKGYLFSGLLFLSMQLQSFFFHQLFHQSTSLGLRLRASLISAVFRKALTMNNQARRDSTVGEVVNLMSVDTEHIESLMSYLWAVWSSPLQIGVSLYLLYSTLGPSMFAGLGVLLLLMPVNGMVMKKLGDYMTKIMSTKDKRMKLINEVLNGMKILKLYAWEPSFTKQISDVRDQELRYLWLSSLWSAGMTFTWTVAPYMVSLITFLTYIYIQDDHFLRPETAFVAISLFNVLRFAINFAPMIITQIIHAVISLRRLNRYLSHDDLDSASVLHVSESEHAITIKNGTFMWNPEVGPTLTNINISVPEGSLVAVVGQVGTGKSSLISAMIGDMEKVDGQVTVKGSVAYVPQQAWIQNNTLRNNILFGEPLQEQELDDCIKACALAPDLEILPAGDLTEIGERGINLSGGQKQRISLARAVYNNADIYLLDDPLSAVDSHVGKHIFNEVIGHSGLLKHKTRVLVTHGVHWLPMVDQIIVLKNGAVSEMGSYDELLSHNGAFAQFLKTYFLQEEDEEEDNPEVQEMRRMVLQRLESITDDDELTDEETRKLERQKSVTSDGKEDSKTEKKDKEVAEKEKEKKADTAAGRDKLIEEEKVEIGKVKWGVFKEYARSLGYIYTLWIVLAYIFYEAGAVLANIWLSKWTDDVDLNNLTTFPGNSSERMDRNNYYLAFYGGFGAMQALFVVAYSFITSLRTVQASKVLHKKMLTRIFQAPMAFFDTTPIGRIVNRFSQDIETIDMLLPMTTMMGLDSACVVLSTLIVISYSTPVFLVAVLPLFVLYFIIQRFYITTSRQLKRLESKTRSPIYNFFSETISGASVIRAYGKEARFIEESEMRVDSNQIFGFSSYTANRWLGFRLEFLGNIVVLLASAVAVAFRDSISGGIVGLSVSYSLEVTANLNWLVRMMSDLETQVVSVERVKEYTELNTEASWINVRHRPPAAWPQNGQVKVENFCLRYRSDLDLALKDLSFTIQPGQKVGIVGRTGAGKSSLTLALFRLIEPAAGQICLDNINIANLGLHDLRNKLTILPQDPVIFAGTLRMNLDPFGDYSDSQVWQALEHAHLNSFVDSLPDKLEYECGEGGENMSVGQRQLLCLARSLLRKTKILILDEATAAVDMETDELIQQTIRQEFSDCTVLTIAHRLNTVMDYDQILVLDKGQLVEYDSPENLLRNPDSIFFQMAQSAGLVS